MIMLIKMALNAGAYNVLLCIPYFTELRQARRYNRTCIYPICECVSDYNFKDGISVTFVIMMHQRNPGD